MSSRNLERVGIQRRNKGLNTALVGLATLDDQTSGGPHGEPSVGNFLSLQPRRLLRVALHESQRVQSEVSRRAVTALASTGRGDTADGLDEHDHDEAGGDVLRVRVPDLPEGVRLALGRGGLASRRGSEELDLDEAQAGEHGHAGVLDLGLSEPVEVDPDIVDVGQAEGVESDVTGHGPVEEGRAVHERQGLRLLRDLAVKLRLLPDAVRRRGEGGGRAGHGQYGCDLGNHGWLEFEL